jgi:hypothetical protein
MSPSGYGVASRTQVTLLGVSYTDGRVIARRMAAIKPQCRKNINRCKSTMARHVLLPGSWHALMTLFRRLWAFSAFLLCNSSVKACFLIFSQYLSSHKFCRCFCEAFKRRGVENVARKFCDNACKLLLSGGTAVFTVNTVCLCLSLKSFTLYWILLWCSGRSREKLVCFLTLSCLLP